MAESDWEDITHTLSEAQRRGSTNLLNPSQHGIRIPTTTSEMQSRLAADKPLETPAIDPIDFIPGAELAKVGGGAALRGMGAIAEGASSKVGTLADLLLGKLAGLGKSEAATYGKNAAAVDSLKAMRQLNPVALESKMSDALKSGANSLGSTVGDLANERAKELVGKTINVNVGKLRGVGGDVEKEVAAIVNKQSAPEEIKNTLSITGTQAERLKELAATQAKYDKAYSAINAAPKDTGAAEVASDLRKGIEGVAPRVGQLNEQMIPKIRTKGAVVKASRNSPEGMFSGSSLKTDAMLQQMAESGAPEVRELAKQYQSAQAIKAGESEGGVLDRLLIKPAALMGLRARNAVAPLTGLPAKGIASAARSIGSILEKPGVARTAQAVALPDFSDDKLKEWLRGNKSNSDEWEEIK